MPVAGQVADSPRRPPPPAADPPGGRGLSRLERWRSVSRNGRAGNSSWQPCWCSASDGHSRLRPWRRCRRTWCRRHRFCAPWPPRPPPRRSLPFPARRWAAPSTARGAAVPYTITASCSTSSPSRRRPGAYRALRSGALSRSAWQDSLLVSPTSGAAHPARRIVGTCSPCCSAVPPRSCRSSPTRCSTRAPQGLGLLRAAGTRRGRARPHGGAHRLSAQTTGSAASCSSASPSRARDRGVRAVELAPAVAGCLQCSEHPMR